MPNNIDFEKLRQASTASLKFDKNNISWKDNKSADDIDSDLKRASEDTYREIAEDIVKISSAQMELQNKSKNDLKKTFTIFFMIFISIQYLILIIFMFIKMFAKSVELTDTVLISYITSVFVETIGAIIIMIKYAFDSKQEVEILKILNGVISNFQKFK